MKFLVPLVLVLSSMLLPMTLTQTVHYVKPDDSISLNCPGQPCLTLDQYTQQAATYFTTGSTFLFLPGNHTLRTTINLTDISDVVFRGMGSIIHGNGGNISCIGVINLTIDELTLKIVVLEMVRSEEILISNSNFLGHRDILNTMYSRNSELTVTNCHFEGNKGEFGGAISIEITNLTIIDSTFTKNEALSDGGAICAENSFISVEGSHFEGNKGELGGAISIEITNLTIIDSTFTKNEALSDGGAISAENSFISVEGSSNNAVIFTGNFAHGEGGAIYLYSTDVLFSGTVILFEDNSSEDGGGIYSLVSSLTFTSTTTFFRGNTVDDSGGAIWSESGEIILSQDTNTYFINNSAHEYGGALCSIKTNIEFSDNITFSYNSAELGGAIQIRGASLQFSPGMNLTTSYNNAREYGGAIFHEDTITRYLCLDNWTGSRLLANCFIELKETKSSSIAIYSYYNSAGTDGSFLFGGLLDRCLLKYTSPGDVVNYSVGYYILESKIHVMQPNNTVNTISSQPYGLKFCSSHKATVHRGQKFEVKVIGLAQGGSVVSTTVTARLSNTARLKFNQASQKISPGCSSISYNIYSTEDDEEVTLHLDGPCSDPGKLLSVTFLPCPPGFSQSNEKCVCEQRLRQYNTTCTIDEDILIMRNDDFWMNASYENGTYHGLILCETCPVNYCKTDNIAISFDNPDIQCALNRTEVLCGACATNHSLMLGSSRCHVCPNTYLALLLPFAAAGIVLVVFMSTLRLTVATGMINSVILYANIVQVNRHLFFPNKVNVLTVFIAWMNLDLGFETCFYNGMTSYQQTWLQFAFPIYIWMLITLIIITSRYSIRVSKLIGHNPIAVLATLLLMSYTKILKIFIDVYSSAKLEYPDNIIVTVWLKDGNVPYLQSWHLLLTVVTSVVFVFLFLPYTLLLLLGYKLYHFSGRKHMRWLNRLKPLLDSYYAPYKTHTRYWTGFLLLARCALYTVFSLGDANKNLFAIIIALFLIVLAFALIPGRIYTTSYTNIMESLVFSNLITLSAITFVLDTKHQLKQLLVYSLVGMVFVIMMGIIVYHFYIHCIPKSLRLKIASFKISAIFHHAKTSKDNIPTNPPSKNTPKEVSTTVIELREPLLDN